MKHLNSKRWSNVGDNDGGDVVGGDVGDGGGESPLVMVVMVKMLLMVITMVVKMMNMGVKYK